MKLIIILSILLFPLISSATDTESKIESTEKYGDYTVTTQLDDKDCDLSGCDRTLFIYKNDEKVFELKSNPPTEEYYPANSPPFNTNESPVLLIKDYSGGMHCCSTFYLFDMGKNFRQLQKIAAGDNDDIINKNNELRLYDPIFSYFFTSFADSPMPKVYLKFADNKLVFDKQKMKRSYNNNEFNQILAKLDQKTNKNSTKTGMASEFLGNTINLIYSGNANLAWKLIDEFFSKGNVLTPPMRESIDFSSSDLKRQILCKLSESLYAKDIEEINEGNIKLPNNCSEEELRMPSALK